MDANDYARLSALVTHAVLIKGIEHSYPALSLDEQNAIIVDILDRVARMQGWELRRMPAEGDGGE